MRVSFAKIFALCMCVCMRVRAACSFPSLTLRRASFPGLQSVVMERLNLKSTRVFALNFCPASGPTVMLDSEDALSVVRRPAHLRPSPSDTPRSL